MGQTASCADEQGPLGPQLPRGPTQDHKEAWTRKTSSEQQDDCLGETVGLSSNREPVRWVLLEVFEFLIGKRGGASSKFPDRRPAGRVHGQHVFGGSRCQRGRESIGSHRIPPLFSERPHGQKQHHSSGQTKSDGLIPFSTSWLRSVPTKTTGSSISTWTSFERSSQLRAASWESPVCIRIS